jgi:hypothetical protein
LTGDVPAKLGALTALTSFDIRKNHLTSVPAALGRAVQVAPNNSKLKPPGTKRLKPKYDEALSNFAFKFNLRRYSSGRSPRWRI